MPNKFWTFLRRTKNDVPTLGSHKGLIAEFVKIWNNLLVSELLSLSHGKPFELSWICRRIRKKIKPLRASGFLKLVLK